MNGARYASSSDAELIALSKGGQIEAFGELYQRYVDSIYRYLRTRVDDPKDAEDLCETAFLRSFEAIDRYEEQGHPFSAYLYRVARNLLADHYRKRSESVGLDEIAEPATTEEDLESAYARSEQIRAIDRSMLNLTEDYQEVIRLRVVLGLPTDTVAAWMERSPGAVRVLLHRALNALRENLDD